MRGGPAVRALRRRPPLASVKPDLHITVMRATCAAPTCHATGCDQLLDLGVMHAETCVFHAGTLRALPTAESRPSPPCCPHCLARLGDSFVAMREQGVVVPENLALAAQDEPDLRRWIASLPETLASVCARWGLTPGTPFQPGGTCSWVAPALRGSGEAVVLKVTWPHAESQDEAGGLRE